MSGLAATLREAEPGTRMRLKMKDGSVIAGAFRDVNGESVSLDDGERIELKQVERIRLEFGSAPRSKPRRKRAA